MGVHLHLGQGAVVAHRALADGARVHHRHAGPPQAEVAGSVGIEEGCLAHKREAARRLRSPDPAVGRVARGFWPLLWPTDPPGPFSAKDELLGLVKTLPAIAARHSSLSFLAKQQLHACLGCKLLGFVYP